MQLEKLVIFLPERMQQVKESLDHLKRNFIAEALNLNDQSFLLILQSEWGIRVINIVTLKDGF